MIKVRTKKEPDILEIQDDSRFQHLLKVLLRMQALEEEGTVQTSGMFYSELDIEIAFCNIGTHT